MKRPDVSSVVAPVASFSRGLSYPLRALKLLRSHPGLLRYLAIPFFINLVVFSLTVYFGLDLFQQLLQTYAPGTDVWYGLALYYLAWILTLLLTMVLVFFSFTIIGNLIASPFNELLSERAEALLAAPQQSEPFAWRRFWTDAGRALLTETKKMGFFVLVMVLLLGLNLLPGLGSLLYAVLAPLFTLFFLVIEYMAFVLMRKNYSFAQQRRYLVRRPFLFFGFGCGVFCLLAIPFVQFFCIPLAVVGATLLWSDFPMTDAA